MQYGSAPTLLGTFDLDFTENMHYAYLPIRIPGQPRIGYSLEPRLRFASSLIERALVHEVGRGNHWDYVYVSARRGWASPSEPLNRPGWHADAFGTPDINYVWTDRFPTRFALGDFGPISEDPTSANARFEEAVDSRWVDVVTFPDKMLMRLDAGVVHTTPDVPAPGGDRCFIKVSFSNNRYNLVGNAHNFDLDYEWPMYERSEVRKRPSRAQAMTSETVFAIQTSNVGVPA